MYLLASLASVVIRSVPEPTERSIASVSAGMAAGSFSSPSTMATSPLTLTGTVLIASMSPGTASFLPIFRRFSQARSFS
jgi:hypothetical protein